ncbi:MAG: aspartyl protease family protein, partial [Rhizomicrobium sp.]
LLLALEGQAQAEKNCQIVHAAAVEMSVDRLGGAVVPMTLQGKNVNMLVDTGGVLSMLAPSTVKAIGAKSVSMMGGRALIGYGGNRIDHIAKVFDVQIGSLTAGSVTFAVTSDNDLPEGIDGTLSSDILTAYDVEFDFAKNTFYLNLTDHCPERVVYWTQAPYARIPIYIDPTGHIEFNAYVDGRLTRAMLDTGSTRSIMSLETAKNLFGLDAKDPRLKLLERNPDLIGKAYSYPFSTLAIEGIVINHPDLTLVSDEDSKMTGGDDPKIILGMGILRQLHLYIDYDEHLIFATGATAH